MAANTQRIEVTLETLLESVDLAESITMRIAEAAGFPDEEIHKIGMAVREGVINAYNYGNQQDRQKKILMTVELAPENMTVRVIDQGQGFELTEIPDPLAEENLAAHLRPWPVLDARVHGRIQGGARPRRRRPAGDDQETARTYIPGHRKTSTRVE